MQTLQSKAGHKEHKWKTLADDEASDFEKQIGGIYAVSFG